MRYQRQNSNARNFGLKSRDMVKAGLNALKEDMKSFSSIATMHSRWQQFCFWIRDEYGIKDMRKIELSHVQGYASHLRNRYEAEDISAATAQNYLSAVNRVMEIARADKIVYVAPVQEGLLPKRTGITTINHSVPEHLHQEVKGLVNERLSCILDLQRELGLRFEESAKIDAQKAYQQAERERHVRISAGTKGGRHRIVPIIHPGQLKALRSAANLQEGRSMIPINQSYTEFSRKSYSAIQNTDFKFHGERHHYAQTRYQEITKVKPPIGVNIKHGISHHRYVAQQLNLSVAQAKMLDKQARKIIAEELGHGRIDVTNNYLG